MIYAFVGTMKSSKTSKLIDNVSQFGEDNCVVFYPACCNKKDGYVVSRDNDKKIKAIKVFEISDMYQYVDNYDKIFIDEVQFISSINDIDKFMNFLEYVDRKHKTIYLFGLSLDYKSNSFTLMERVLPYVDEVVNCTSVCEVCGSPFGTRCVRYNGDTVDCDPNSSLLLMENENVSYVPVCRDCYRKLTGQNAIT